MGAGFQPASLDLMSGHILSTLARTCSALMPPTGCSMTDLHQLEAPVPGSRIVGEAGEGGGDDGQGGDAEFFNLELVNYQP